MCLMLFVVRQVLAMVSAILDHNSKIASVTNAGDANASAPAPTVVETGLDVFGTKFYPSWPAGGRTVNWHQDSHYFGTYSPQIVSCGFYIEDSVRETGCFRCVPGTHAEGIAWPHQQGTGAWSHGEWVALETDPTLGHLNQRAIDLPCKVRGYMCGTICARVV
jgi:ectoine hydroxylase-related dioxygenase (phytanoyl-CoA dioxygenase family)